MKKLITLILGITLAYSCSTNTSSNNNAAVTDIDGNIYQTITICSQTWAKTNLNVSKYRNGDIIPQVTDATQWAALTTGAWCYYNNDPANGVIYGKLYNWYAVNDPRGLAPAGYHIPTNDEWTTLTTCLGGENAAGSKMKETGTTHWNMPNQDASNSSSFTGLPGGFRFYDGEFSYIGRNGEWWGSSEYDTPNAWYCYLNYNIGKSFSYHHEKTRGKSVRCVKN